MEAESLDNYIHYLSDIIEGVSVKYLAMSRISQNNKEGKRTDSELMQEEVEQFLERSFAQQIKERNTCIGNNPFDFDFFPQCSIRTKDIFNFSVRGQYVVLRRGKVEAPVTPNFSSAVNIRNFYIKELTKMR